MSSDFFAPDRRRQTYEDAKCNCYVFLRTFVSIAARLLCRQCWNGNNNDLSSSTSLFYVKRIFMRSSSLFLPPFIFMLSFSMCQINYVSSKENFQICHSFFLVVCDGIEWTISLMMDVQAPIHSKDIIDFQQSKQMS